MLYSMIKCNNTREKQRKRKHVPERNEGDGGAEVIPAAVPSDGLISHEIIVNLTS
jgi:hypothetical protein